LISSAAFARVLNPIQALADVVNPVRLFNLIIVDPQTPPITAIYEFS